MKELFLNLHHFMPFSRANGPGLRAVLWLQGCHLQCPECINPETHDPEKGQPRTVMELHKTISELTGIEGVTISGGEPLEQIDPLNELLKNIRQRTELSILLFSGFTLPEIKAMPTGENLLSRTDILISGRYQQNHPSDLPWIASGNQKVHFLTDRYTLVDLEPIPDSEILIGAGGELEITGINSFRMESQF